MMGNRDTILHFSTCDWFVCQLSCCSIRTDTIRLNFCINTCAESIKTMTCLVPIMIEIVWTNYVTINQTRTFAYFHTNVILITIHSIGTKTTGNTVGAELIFITGRMQIGTERVFDTATF